MKLVIIEDELLAAEGLAKIILMIDPSVEIIAILPSVKKAIEWFNSNKEPDLIFSDIQLTDGLSFEILKSVKCTTPVIFCTAFEEFALKAFKANGIDYILKPFDKKAIADALIKYKSLKENLSKNEIKYESILELFENKSTQKNWSVLANYKGGIIPININDIALFYIENGINNLITFDKKKYIVDKCLEELKKITNNDFFRVNKQFLINRKIVGKVQKYSEHQYSIFLNFDFIDKVSIRKEKINDFYEWLTKK